MTKLLVLLLLACFLFSNAQHGARSNNAINSVRDEENYNQHLMTLFLQLIHQVSHAQAIFTGAHHQLYSFEYCACLKDLLRHKKALLEHPNVNLWQWFLNSFYVTPQTRLSINFLDGFILLHPCHLGAFVSHAVHITKGVVDSAAKMLGSINLDIRTWKPPAIPICTCPCPAPFTHFLNAFSGIFRHPPVNHKCPCPCPLPNIEELKYFHCKPGENLVVCVLNRAKEANDMRVKSFVNDFLHRKCMREVDFYKTNANKMIEILKHERSQLGVIGSIIQAQNAYLAAHNLKNEKLKEEAEEEVGKAIDILNSKTGRSSEEDDATCEMKHLCDNPEVRHMFNSTKFESRIRVNMYYVGKQSSQRYFMTSMLNNKINEVFANMGLQFEFSGTVNHIHRDMSKMYVSMDSNTTNEFGKFIPVYELADQVNIPRPGQNELVVIIAPLFWTSNNGFAYFPGEKHHGYIALDENIFVMTEIEVSGILIHEIGHALGLYHTYHHTFPCGRCAENSASDLTGDFCEDTPPDNQFLFGNFDSNHQICHTRNEKGPFVIPQCHTDKRVAIANMIPLGNYMSNREPGCRFEFTKCQYARMNCYAHWLWNRPKFDSLVEVEEQ